MHSYNRSLLRSIKHSGRTSNRRAKKKKTHIIYSNGKTASTKWAALLFSVAPRTLFTFQILSGGTLHGHQLLSQVKIKSRMIVARMVWYERRRVCMFFRERKGLCRKSFKYKHSRRSAATFAVQFCWSCSQCDCYTRQHTERASHSGSLLIIFLPDCVFFSSWVKRLVDMISVIQKKVQDIVVEVYSCIHMESSRQ